MANSTTQKHLFGQKSVAAAATAEALVSSHTLVSALLLIAHDDNTGRVFYGGSDVDSSTQRGLAAGESVVIESQNEYEFDLQEMFLDVSVSGEGADFIATLARRGPN